ncbi:pilus assembly protein PilP [bacterium]|nr:pilus assembly protein PilP [bacterium]
MIDARFRNISRTLFLAAAIFAVAILAGCPGGGDEETPAENAPPLVPEATPVAMPDPEALAQRTQEKIERAIETPDVGIAAQPAPVSGGEGYMYDPINKIDPFARFSSDVDYPFAGGKDENILTQYEVRYFRLVGVVTDDAQPRAIFEDPKGRAYVVNIGTAIGRNLGVIDQITDNAVVITEQRFNPALTGPDQLESVQLVIKLHPERERES